MVPKLTSYYNFSIKVLTTGIHLTLFIDRDLNEEKIKRNY